MRRLISDAVWLVALPLWLLVCAAQAQFNSFPPGAFTGRAALDASSGVAATIWNPAAIGTGIALSNGNLTATYTGSSSTNAGKSNTSHSTGKFYYETLWSSSTGGGSNAREFGIGNGSAGTTGYQVGVSDANSIAYGLGGATFFTGSSIGSVLNCGAGGGSGFCAIAVDFGANKIWLFSDNVSSPGWNDDVLANQNPATGTGGYSLSITGAPYFAMFSLFATADTVTACFLPGCYNYMPPVGFGNW